MSRGRADCENRIKELKYDFAADSFNMKDFWATEATLNTVMLAVPRDIELALEAGFVNYLTKPIRVQQFMSALDAVLKRAPGGFTRVPGR